MRSLRKGERPPSNTASVRDLVDAGRKEVPNPQRLRGIGASLGFGAPGGATAAVAKGATAASLLSGATASTKIAAVVLLGLATAGGLAVQLGPKAQVATSPRITESLSAATIPNTPPDDVVATAQRRPPVSDPPSEAPAFKAPVRRGIVAPPPTVESIPSASSPTPVNAPSPAGVDVSAAAVASPSPEPTRVPVPEKTAPPPPPSVETQFDLLSEAQRAVRADPARALQIADRDATLHPFGALAQEREMIAIQALVTLGRRGDATLRAARFRATNPGSAYEPRIDALLGIDAGAHKP